MHGMVFASADNFGKDWADPVADLADPPIWMIAPELRHDQTVWVLYVMYLIGPKRYKDFEILLAGAVDHYTEWIVSAEWNEEIDTVDTVAMGDTDRQRFPTFKDGSISLEFHQDFAASATYATVVAAFGTAVAVAYRPDAGTISATNPEMQTNAIVTEFNLGGSVGDIVTTSVTWPFDGTGVTRAVA